MTPEALDPVRDVAVGSGAVGRWLGVLAGRARAGLSGSPAAEGGRYKREGDGQKQHTAETAKAGDRQWVPVSWQHPGWVPAYERG